MSEVFSPSHSSFRMLVGGDISLDLDLQTVPFVGAYRLKGVTRKRNIITKIVNRLRRGVNKAIFSPNYFGDIANVPFQELLLKKPENIKKRDYGHIDFKKIERFNIDYTSIESKYGYPFEKITSFMKEKDLVLVNLEAPLSNHPRIQGHFINDPQYARVMKDSGISIVSLANNHIFEAGEIGFLDTISHLNNAGISYTGGGMNLEEARRGKFIQMRDMKFIFLSYTQFCNHRYTSMAADYPGILPMDRELMLEDIKSARRRADFIFVSLHWGFEDQPTVHPKQTEIAHLLIDSGADGIIGHHPHVPHGIEVYKKKPVIYSLGNFIFGFYEPKWTDNILAEVIIEEKSIRGIIIYPISGRGRDLYQPEVLNGHRANSLLQELKMRSAVFNTGIAIHNGVGFIKIK